MTTLSTDTLKQEVKAVFGQTLTDERIEAGKGRLPTMLDNARLLSGWAGRLGETGPAQVQRPIETPSDG
ncbi:MAG: hypothetical protein AAF543_00020 [Pseudomonadota bacterium]